MAVSGEGFLDPLAWTDGLSAPPVVALQRGALSGGGLRRWIDTSPEMIQPRLSHHYVVMHLGGAKRVHRNGDGPPLARDVAAGDMTTVPAGARFNWATHGPIDFAHLYIDPARLSRAVASVFDRDPARFELEPRVGLPDRLLGALFEELLGAVTQNELVKPYLELLFESFLARLVLVGGNLPAIIAHAPHVLAPSRLRAVTDYVEAHFADEICLDTLARIAGLSRFHFARAFKRSTGSAPYAYLTARRLAEARRLLRETVLSPAEIAAACGYTSVGRLSTAFRVSIGVTPTAYRAAAR